MAALEERGMAIDTDLEIVGSAPYPHSSADYNTRRNTIYTGGESPSHLLLPLLS